MNRKEDSSQFDLSDILRLKAELAAYNRMDLAQVEFLYEGQRVEIERDALMQFAFTGLNNTDLVEWIDLPLDLENQEATGLDENGVYTHFVLEALPLTDTQKIVRWLRDPVHTEKGESLIGEVLARIAGIIESGAHLRPAIDQWNKGE